MNWYRLKRWMALGHVVTHVAGIVCGLWLVANSAALGAEPYERFLQKLRDEQLFDLALIYLKDLQEKPDVSQEFKADIELERGLLLYQSAAVMPATKPERPRLLDDAEAALRTFLETRKQHPRRGEARMKLGELLLTRAEEAKLLAGAQSTTDNPDAIKFYDQAHQLFEATIAELATVLEGMKGARVDASNTSAVAYRQKLQKDIRQSQLLSAKSVEDRGRSRAANSPQRTKDLEQALSMFSDLYSKELGMVAVRNYALFYRSGIHATLGKLDDAIDGFQRIADAEGVDFLRPLQSNAIAELIKLLGQQKKFSLAIDRADKWIANLRPDERTTTETLNLKLELAKQKVAWAEELQAKDPQDRVAGRLIRDTRNELRNLMRTAGGHLEQARELMGKLGVEETPVATQDLPVVKNFEEAFAAAQERLERSETAAIGLEAINMELADGQTSDDRKQELQQQLQTTQAAIDVDQQQALELFHTALRLYQSSDGREKLYDARFRLAFLLLKQQRPWDAMAVAEFLSRSAAGTDKGLRAAAIALSCFSDLLRVAGEEAKVNLTAQLRPFAEYLVATWPQSAEAAAAAAALVQLALINKDYQQAEQFLNMVPAAAGEATAKLRRDAGLAFNVQYVEEKNAAGEQAESTVRLRQLTMDLLQSGVVGLTAETLDASGLDAVNLLSRLLLADNQLDKATAMFFDSPSSPLKAIEKKRSSFPARSLMDTYRTDIQLTIALLNGDKLAADQAVKQIRESIKQLQSLAHDAASQEILSDIFVSLARDLKDQLGSIQDDSKRKKMSETLILVASEAAKATSFKTEYWAADTIVSIAQELEKTAGGKAPSQSAYSAAAKILDAILAKEEKQPGWIDPPEFGTQVRLRLAQTARGQGDYKNAIEQLATVLKENSRLLDVQMEAARTYQAWGDHGDSRFHKVAIEGGRPDPKTRINLIWGWGSIQQKTANQPKFTAQFFEARYQLAYSRMRYALGLPDPQLKSDELKRAEHDIESTAKLYPDLGGPVMKQRFQTLLKTIQQAQ